MIRKRLIHNLGNGQGSGVLVEEGLPDTPTEPLIMATKHFQAQSSPVFSLCPDQARYTSLHSVLWGLRFFLETDSYEF